MKGTLKSAKEIRKIPEVTLNGDLIDLFIPDGLDGYGVPAMLFAEDSPMEIQIVGYQVHEDGSRYYGARVTGIYGEQIMWFHEIFFEKTPGVEKIIGHVKVRSKEDLEKDPAIEQYIDEEGDSMYRWMHPNGKNKQEVQVEMIDDARQLPDGLPIVESYSWNGHEVFIGFASSNTEEFKGKIFSRIHLPDGVYGEFEPLEEEEEDTNE